MTDQTNPRARLAGRRIVVTGGASGIGRAIAELFAAEGAKLALFDIDEGAVAQVAEGIGAVSCAVNVADPASVKSGIAKAADAMGGIDGLVNCAGVVMRQAVADVVFEDWKRQIDINLTGTFLMCQAALPWLAQSERASIVNIASAQAMQPTANFIAYAASKGGVISLTRGLAVELAPGIRVNAVSPGLVDTPMHVKLRGNSTEVAPTVSLDRYALRRSSSAEEIARAVLFMASDEASYVTGATLAVDGGRTFY